MAIQERVLKVDLYPQASAILVVLGEPGSGLFRTCDIARSVLKAADVEVKSRTRKEGKDKRIGLASLARPSFRNAHLL